MKSALLYVVSMITVGLSFRMLKRKIPCIESCRKQITTLFHQAPADAPVISPEDQAKIDSFRANQAGAKRLSFAEEVRTLIDQSTGYGVLSTNSVQFAGYPTGSVVGFQVDEQGLPFFVFSTMSAHTTDVIKDDKASLTVTAKDFKGAAEGRVVLVGNVKKVLDTESKGRLRDLYLARHKDAFWIDFGDFSYFRMDSLVAVRFVGGFAMAGSVTPEDYQAAQPDPLAGFSGPVLKHMNDDHADSTVAMVKHYAGVENSEAQIVSIDRLGMTVKAKLDIFGGGYSKVRLSFPREVTDRKAVKQVLVEMTQASMS